MNIYYVFCITLSILCIFFLFNYYNNLSLFIFSLVVRKLWFRKSLLFCLKLYILYVVKLIFIIRFVKY